MKKRILCFGDSNTWGFNPESGNRFNEEQRWTCLLQTLLGSDYTVIEEGENCRTNVVKDPYKGVMAGIDYLVPCLHSHKPFDLIILMLGTNDTKNIYGAPSDCIAMGQERLIKLINSSDSGIDNNPPKILLIAPPYIKEKNGFPSVFDQEAVNKSHELAKHYETLALKYQISFLDASKFVETSDIDGVHLDINGHKVFAEKIYEKVKEIIA